MKIFTPKIINKGYFPGDFFANDVTSEDGQLTDIAQPIRNIIIVLCLPMEVNKEVKSQEKKISAPCT